MRTSHALFTALLLSNGALSVNAPSAAAAGVSVNVGVGGNSSSPPSTAVTTPSSVTAATGSTPTTSAKQTQKKKAKATSKKKAKATSKKKSKARATSKKTKSTKSATTSSQVAAAHSQKQQAPAPSQPATSSQAPAASQPAGKPKQHAGTGSSPATVVTPTSSSPAAGAPSSTHNPPTTSSNPEGIIGQNPTKHSKTTPVDTSIAVFPSASGQFSASVEFTFKPAESGVPSGSFSSAEFTFYPSGSESFVPPLFTGSASSAELVSGYAISTALSPSFVASLTPPSGAPTTLSPSYTQYSAVPSLVFSSSGVTAAVESSSTQSYNPYLTASVSSSSGQSVFTFHHHTYHLGPETLTAGGAKPTGHHGGPKKNDAPSKPRQGWLAAAAVCVVSGLVTLL